MFRSIQISLLGLLVLTTYPRVSYAQDWTRFRGPNGSGISQSKSIPTRWTAEDFTWQVQVAGSGYSSPVVWANRLFMTSADKQGGARSLICIDTRDGTTLWNHQFSDAAYVIHQLNSRASATPALDAGHVFVLWGTDDELIAEALTHDGDRVWAKSLGPYKSLHGMAASPIVHDGMLFVANDQDKESSVMALDAATGKTKWSLPRNTTANYSTPCLLESGDRPVEVVLSSRDQGVSAINAESGKLSWEVSVFRSHVSVASPIVAGKFIVGVSGGVGVPEELVTIELNDKQKPAAPAELYRLKRAMPFVPTPLAHRGMLFTVSDEGIATCIDLTSGKVHWRERLQNKFYSSPICVDDRIFFAATDGEVVVVAASDKFRLLARNQASDGFHATPAVSGNRMFLRTFTSLICIGE